MRALLRILRISAGHQNGSWLALLLLLVVLAPSLCLLWFMNQAVQNERLAVRQKLVDAYRGHLSLAVQRLNNFWRDSARELETEGEKLPASAVFAKEVRNGLADALVCLDATGNVVYPGGVPVPKREAPDVRWSEAQSLELNDPVAAAGAFGRLVTLDTNADQAARALQAQARCLVRAGRTDAAISVLRGSLAEERYRQATDFQGRLLVPDAELMALQLLKNSAPDSAPDQTTGLLQRLKQQLLDYGDSNMPAPQRRFLMHELEKLFPGQAVFPTLAAEDLAARYVESARPHLAEPGLRPTHLTGVWQFGSANGRVVALHRTESLLVRMRAAITSEALPEDVRVEFLTPGREAETALVSLPAGPNLEGWRLALSLKDPQLFDMTTNARITSYVWIGALVVATVLVLAALALRLMRQQLALTQLKNDLVANVTHELKTPLSSMRLLVDTLLDSRPLNEQTAREYLQLIAKENARLSRLIDNFLTFSRIERNKYAFDFNETPVAAIADGAIAAVRERFHAPGCRFQAQIPPHLPPVVADSDAMVTALLNLLDNAWKYSGDEKEITLTAGAENGSVFFAVHDNGVGLAPRETKRIFKRFYQVDRQSFPSSGGCGLGLSIVKFIVTAHHGAIRVESQPGKGSTFTITIPAVKSSPESDEGNEPPKP